MSELNEFQWIKVYVIAIQIDDELYESLPSLDSRMIVKKIQHVIEFYDQTKQFDKEIFTVLYYSVQQVSKDDILNCLANYVLLRSDSRDFQILQLKFLSESCDYLKKNKKEQLLEIQKETLFQMGSFDKFGKFGASTLLNFYSQKIKNLRIKSFLERQFKRVIKEEILHNYLITTLVQFSFNTEDCDQQISDLIIQSDDTFFATKYIIDLAQNCLGVSANENVSVRQIMKILAQISASLPNIFNQNLQPFLLFYDHDNHVLRNTTNMIITNILTEYLSPNNIQQDSNLNEIHTKQRNFLILKLCTRILDKQAYSRINTLNMLKIVCSQNLIPTNIILQLFPVTIPRVCDASSFVRKAALTLLKQIIKYMKKIFVEGLQMDYFMTISEINDQNLLFQQDIRKTNIALDQIQEEKSSAQNHADFQILEAEEKLVRQSLKEKLRLAQVFNQYYQAMELVQALIPKLEQLLQSKCISDVSKTISLICFLFKQRIENSHVGLMKILTHSTNPQIVGKVAKKFFSIFFEKEKEQTQGENLFQLFKYASSIEQIYLEELINQMINKKMIQEKMIRVVFAQFLEAHKKQQKEELEIYSKLVRICFSQLPQSITNQQIEELNQLIESQKSVCNWILVKEMAKLIKYLQHIDVVQNFFFKFAQILYFFFGTNNFQWFAACKEIMHLINLLVKPEAILEYLIKKFTIQLFSGTQKSQKFSQNIDTEQNFLEQESVFVFNDIMIKFSQLFFIVGNSTLILLVNIDEADNYLKNMKTSKVNEETEDDKIFGGCEAECEYFSSKLQKIFKSENLRKGLFEIYVPKLEDILFDINENTKITILQKTAGICLTNFMCISEKFCELHIEKVFKWIKMKNLDVAFKSNLIVALGDLSNRWPNTATNYCRGLFDGLEKQDYIVKKTALHMLQHQIMNDTIKIQREMSTIALLISDEDEKIQNLAKQFFHSLYTKDSRKLINGLFDILSTLSNEKEYLKYQNFLSFIIKYLDKASDQLTERLLKRMKDNIDSYEVQNIAYTLSKFQMKESLTKKYYDCYPYYQERLQDRTIKEFFFTIVQKVQLYILKLLKCTMSNENFQILRELGELLQKGETKRRFISSKFKTQKQASQFTSQQVSEPQSSQQDGYQSSNTEP